MKKAPCAVLLAALVLLGLSGCRHKEITEIQRKEAANLVSEAQFATTVRDYARAEGLYAQATELCPDTPDYWIILGVTRKRLNNPSGAKKAYEQAVDAFDGVYKKYPKQPEVLLQKAYVQALLGHFDDAKTTVEQAQKNHGDNRTIQSFAETNQLDKIINSAAFKEVAL